VDEDGNPVLFWKGTIKTFTVTVNNSAGTAVEDISSWISSPEEIWFQCKGKLTDAAYIWNKKSSDGSVAFLTDGTDGKFTVSLAAADLATAYDSILVWYTRYDGTSQSNDFKYGVWTSSIRSGLI
jgi:hypothetical protein